jgi:hypothetical protein
LPTPKTKQAAPAACMETGNGKTYEVPLQWRCFPGISVFDYFACDEKRIEYPTFLVEYFLRV